MSMYLTTTIKDQGKSVDEILGLVATLQNDAELELVGLTKEIRMLSTEIEHGFARVEHIENELVKDLVKETKRLIADIEEVKKNHGE